MPTPLLYTLPSATSSLTYAGTWSGPVFNEFLPIALVGAGLVIAGMILAYLIGKIQKGAAGALGRSRRGSRRRHS